ncbi:MAG: hypothetical protein K9N09_10770 [Candidatus Cloacimonetes bacterium]|nr:hypothetical protein [Candidatus Cloacimonadota bacterium]MCF7813466.1 hypothetical protein [Candidatus Cloacimonadota bacterium]MCF7869168.1 hypothetical protein [Candidatus Cloacimonadota bacterium]MCF7883398.1 hypothetical protein [Candidatus Cloacimonadota bacterium]
MKKLFFIIFIFVAFQLIFGQTAYFGMGYNVASGSFKNLNKVVKEYNDVYEEYLTSKMDEIHLNHGMVFDFGLAMPYFSFSFGLQYNRAKTHALLVGNSGVKHQQDIWLRCLSLPMDFGINIDSGSFAFDPGIGINFMFWRYFTRFGEKSDIDDTDYDDSVTDINMHVKFFTKFVFGGFEEPGLGFVVEPYYNLGIIGSSMNDLSADLLNYYIEKIDSFNHYGVRLYFIIKG